MPAQLAQEINRAPLGNDAQPSGERAGRIVGLAGTMDRQQHILHYVVAAIRRDTTPAGYSLDQWNTITQQRFVRRTVTTLRRSHLGRATQIIDASGLRIGRNHQAPGLRITYRHARKWGRKQRPVPIGCHHVRLKHSDGHAIPAG